MSFDIKQPPARICFVCAHLIINSAGEQNSLSLALGYTKTHFQHYYLLYGLRGGDGRKFHFPRLTFDPVCVMETSRME
jgi:hypothetical protein